VFRFIRIEPPSSRYREEDVAHVSLDDCPLGGIGLWSDLLKGEPINMESIFQERMKDARMEDYGSTEEEASNALHSEIAQDFVELLNCLVHAPGGSEFSAESTFQLVESDHEEEEAEGEAATF